MIVRAMGHLVLFLMLAAQTGAAGQERSQDEEGWWTSPAGLKHRLYAPKSSKARPGLILLLHGEKEGPESLEAEFKDPCLKAGFVVAAPLSTAFESPNASDKGWSRQDDPKLVALTRELALAYRVDRTRMYIIGMSPRNRGGNVVFMGRTLYTGYVSVGGSPSGFLRTLDGREQMEMGIYFIIGADDPNKGDTVRTRDQAKREGLRDVVFKEVPGVGHAVPEGCSKDALKWITRERRKFVPGGSSDLPWVTGKSVFPRWNLVYAHSSNARFKDACRAVEWDWFADPEMIKRAQAMDCVRFTLENDAAQANKLGIREPSVVFVSPDGEVKLRLAARQVLALRKSTSRSKDAFKGYRKFRDGLKRMLDGAMR